MRRKLILSCRIALIRVRGINKKGKECGDEGGGGSRTVFGKFSPQFPFIMCSDLAHTLLRSVHTAQKLIQISPAPPMPFILFHC